MKPKPGTPNVFCHPIPNSPYSVRLFPGSIALREYCLDFVDTATGNPVNSPPGFEVWSVRGGSAGMGDGVSARVLSLEHTFGFGGASLKPGAEKFVLRDGQTCLLKRPGYRDVQFKVPTRTEGLNLKQPDVDHLEFPELV
ncbi:hypothetical protein GSI_11370 [Ganoderma sinense ZZ0214-1]|uniref:Uncharacterized protein n=1 Tax=Ganoderma sinense ZZ0214-1 TaxID=1077348 RepID=A0A2G8RVT2_9APHY|nr:hypothetical protein GSI_11370 [Ganoderma sinense ZZ0214-1]